MKLSYFNNLHDNEPKPLDATWERFCNAVRSPKVRFAKEGTLFSPATFSGPRAKDNVVEVSMLVLDFDHDCAVNDEWGVIRESGYTAALYTTHSHQRETPDHPYKRDAFRICIPLSNPIPPDKYPLLWQWAYTLTGEKIDRAAKDASRMFYTPVKASDDAPYEWRIQDGDLLDWESLTLREPERPVVHTNVHTDSRNRYIQRAFEAEISLVLSAANGLRNDQLNKSAFALGQFVGSGALSEGEVVAALERAAKGVGLTGSEIPGTIRSGIAAGRQTPRSVPESQYSSPVQVLSEKVNQKEGTVTDEYVSDIGTLAERMLAYRHERETRQHVNTGWPELDAIFQPVKPCFTIVTGSPSSGKSTFLDCLAVNLYRNHGWRYAIFSFETLPIEQHACMIVSLLANKPYSVHFEDHLTDREIREWCDRTAGHFTFHAIPPEMRTIEGVSAFVQATAAKTPIDSLIFDPWAELLPATKLVGGMTDYIQGGLMKMRHLTYEMDICTFLVAHPTKMPVESRGRQADRVLQLEDISGSAHFSNKADVGISVHRHDRGGPDDHVEVFNVKTRRGFPGRLGSVRFDFQQPVGSYDVRYLGKNLTVEYERGGRYGRDY